MDLRPLAYGLPPAGILFNTVRALARLLQVLRELLPHLLEPFPEEHIRHPLRLLGKHRALVARVRRRRAPHQLLLILRQHRAEHPERELRLHLPLPPPRIRLPRRLPHLDSMMLPRGTPLPRLGACPRRSSAFGRMTMRALSALVAASAAGGGGKPIEEVDDFHRMRLHPRYDRRARGPGLLVHRRVRLTGGRRYSIPQTSGEQLVEALRQLLLRHGHDRVLLLDGHADPP